MQQVAVRGVDLEQLEARLGRADGGCGEVLHDRVASCLEGGIFAAAALRVIGFLPLIFDLEAEQDTDHVIAIFKVRGHWGAVAKSNFTGCRYREPVYRSLRERHELFQHLLQPSRRTHFAALLATGEPGTI